MVSLNLSLICLILCHIGLAPAIDTSHRDVDIYCKLIDSKVPGRISYPKAGTYQESVSSYYSGQERDFRPNCIFSPQDTSEVSQFMKLITKKAFGCSSIPQFAIRSGGHMIWPGAANINHGITIDMRAMSQVILNEDKSVATLGAGGIWSDIYAQLAPYNLTVMGGRVSGIGVGGLATGGGIHFLSRRHGWVCDNIYRYEVVLASGDVIEATASSYEDLWLALKGGSNNFGIVTKIEVPTWKTDKMSGLSLTFSYTQGVLDSHAQAWSDYMREENFDDAALGGMVLVFDKGSYVVGDALFYAEPVEKPAVYANFTRIEPKLSEPLYQLTNASALVKQNNGLLPPNTTRAIDIVYSFRNGEAEVYSELFKAWEEGTKALAGIEGLQLILLIQPHPVTNGTNSLGLEPGRKDEVISVITAAYTHKQDDTMVQKEMESVIAKHEASLKQRGLYIPFQYLNYADGTQDPIHGYGADVVHRLRTVSRKYDPHGVFQTQVPGGFKLFS